MGRNQDGCGEPDNRNVVSWGRAVDRMLLLPPSDPDTFSPVFLPLERQPACSSLSHVLPPWLHDGRRGRGRGNRVSVSRGGKGACDVLSDIDGTRWER